VRRYRFALLGFGNVGRALARHFVQRRELLAARFGVELALAAVADRSAALFAPDGAGFDAARIAELAARKEAGRPLAGQPASEPPLRAERLDLRARAIDGLVVALPTNLDGGEPGLALARAALADGLDVLLADKGPALFALPELEQLAAARGRFLGTSATTGSALPSLAVLRGWFGGGTLAEIRGILNGTSNLILSRLREPGATYASALLDAQRAGIAEPDPRLDVEGSTPRSSW
jgi:homoserine dehydrogenase